MSLLDWLIDLVWFIVFNINFNNISVIQCIYIYNVFGLAKRKGYKNFAKRLFFIIKYTSLNKNSSLCIFCFSKSQVCIYLYIVYIWQTLTWSSIATKNTFFIVRYMPVPPIVRPQGMNEEWFYKSSKWSKPCYKWLWTNNINPSYHKPYITLKQQGMSSITTLSFMVQ
jgi:hypothetical protein